MQKATEHSPDVRNGIAERRERQRLEARRSILDATEALLVEGGGLDFSIRSLSGRCGYSAPTVYHYFGDKDGVIDALLEERVTRLADEIARVPATDDPLVDLRSMLLTFIEFSTINAAFTRLMWSLSSKGESRMPSAMERVRERAATAIRTLIDDGRFAGFDAETAGQVIWAVLHGVVSLRLNEPDHPWNPQLAERALDTLLRGMTTPEVESQ
jgi:AcrR family transcriptional regulator